MDELPYYRYTYGVRVRLLCIVLPYTYGGSYDKVGSSGSSSVRLQLSEEHVR